MTRTFCDRCETATPPDALYTFEVPVDVTVFKNKLQRVEVCDACLRAFQAWLHPTVLRAVGHP